MSVKIYSLLNVECIGEIINTRKRAQRKKKYDLITHTKQLLCSNREGKLKIKYIIYLTKLFLLATH